MASSDHQWQSGAISGHQWQSEARLGEKAIRAISGNHWQSVARLGEEAIRGHPISDHQWQSVARLGEEAGGFEQAEAVVVHGVLIEDEEDEHVPDEGCKGCLIRGAGRQRHP